MHTWRVVLTNGKEWKIEANEIEVSENTLIFWIGNEIFVSYGPGSWNYVVREEWLGEHATCLGR